MQKELELKERITSMLILRQWRSLHSCFPNGQNNLINHLDLGEIKYLGYTLANYLNYITKASDSWGSLVRMDANPQEAKVADIFSEFRQWKRHLHNLPGGTDVSGVDDNQVKDWFQSPFDQDLEIAERLEELARFWEENGDHIQSAINGANEPDTQISDRIQAEVQHYSKAKEFNSFILKAGQGENENQILEMLKGKPSVAEAEKILGKTNSKDPQLLQWIKRVAQAKEQLASVTQDSRMVSEADDLVRQKELEKSIEHFQYFKEYAGIAERLKRINNRLDLVKRIKNSIGNDSTGEAAAWFSQLPPNYQLNPNREMDSLRLRIDLEKLYYQICSQSAPDEKTFIDLEAKYKKSSIAPPKNAQERFEIARERIEILNQLEEKYSPRRPLENREEAVREIFAGKEAILKNWKDPKILEPLEVYHKKKEKIALEIEIKTILENKDANGAIKIIASKRDEALANTPFWQQSRQKFQTLVDKGKGFIQLLGKIRAASETNLLERELGSFRDASILPEEFNCFKKDIEKILEDKIRKWKITIREFRNSRGNPGVYYLGWRWPNKYLVNRVYLTIEKGKFPKSTKEALLVKETQPFEFDMLNSGTFLLSNAKSFEGFILTVWPGSEFFDYANRKQWISFIGQPQHFQWLAEKNKWDPCNKAEPANPKMTGTP